ncbi:DNA polymerase III subunits gamma and tau [Streptococcus pneumoniae]|nr:DNA polymerase III subunits gamma and tau [Streptococcus pneumoniae]
MVLRLSRLKQELSNVGAVPKQVAPAPSRPATGKTAP